MADYGTNNGSAFSRPGTPPEPNSSDTVLVARTDYDGAGRAYQMTDNKGIVTRLEFDDLGRRTKLIENHVDGTPSGDTDRTTVYTYNADGQVVTQTADMPEGTDDQVTTYVYSLELDDKGCVVPSNSYLRAIIYPDSDDEVSNGDLANGTDSTYDRIEMTYNADGSLATRKDQRQVVLTHLYDDAGRRTEQKITSGSAQGIQQIKYSYNDLGQLHKVTSYSVIDTTIANEVQYAYNGLGQITAEYQEHAGAVNTGTSPRIQYVYDTTVSSNVFTKGHRLKYKVYPNGREVHSVYDGHDGIDDAISRINKLSDGSGGTAGAAIVAYDLLGSGRAVVRDYPTPQVSLDHHNGSWSESTSGLDRFGRVIRHAWTDYGADPDAPVIRIDHAYDRASNRLHAHNQTHPSASQKYAYDDLHRLASYRAGAIKSDFSDAQAHWSRAGRQWELDQVGNHSAVDDLGATGFVNRWQSVYNDANEITARDSRGDAKPKLLNDQFSSSATEDNWILPAGAGDDFDIDGTTAGRLTVTTLSRDTFDSVQEPEAAAIVLIGQSIGPVQIQAVARFPSGATTGQAGVVFGYKSANDYWIQVQDLADSKLKLYRVLNGNKTLVADRSFYSISANTDFAVWLSTQRNSLRWPGLWNFADGHPSGRVGLWTNVEDTDFNYFWMLDDSAPREALGRWMMNTDMGVSNSRMQFAADAHRHLPNLLKGLRVRRFQATFAIRREVGMGETGVSFVFNATDANDYDFVSILHRDTQTAPTGGLVNDGTYPSVPSETGTAGNMPSLSSSDVLWVRVTNDGTNLTVKAATSEAGLATASDCYTSGGFRQSGGMIGFWGPHGSWASVDDLTILADRDENGSYETTEHFDNFTQDGSGFGVETPVYDAAGNLTYDGVFRYAYDAWNRTVSVTKGYRDSGGTLCSGSVDGGVNTMSYDGLGRRIMKTVSNSADWDCPYHYYYDGQSAVETRNGSGQVLKQQVWGITYIDELVQMAANSDPGSDSTCDAPYWALADANYNVAGIVDGDGLLVERYEYTPYGQRTVFFSPGDNDLGCHAPTLVSRRHVISTVAQPWGLCEFGHQGLMHDEETGNICGRTRMYTPFFARWNQRDRKNYIDGMNLSQCEQSNPVNRLDPHGYASGTARGTTLLGQTTFVGPNAAVISFIDRIDTSDISVSDLIAEYQQATGSTLTYAQGWKLLIAIEELAKSANPAAAASFTGASWAAFVNSKEYRGYTFLQASICCAGGSVVSWSIVQEGDSQGYTPIRSGSNEVTYMPGEGWLARTDPAIAPVPGTACVTFSRMNDFRVGQLGQAVAQILTGVGVPFAWNNIEYTMCCSGRWDVTFRGSHFPTHYTYINSTKVGGRDQKGLPAFMFTRAGTGAAGGDIP